MTATIPTTLAPTHPLRVMWDAREGLDPDRVEAFDALLIGALSARVPDALFIGDVRAVQAVMGLDVPVPFVLTEKAAGS